MGLKGMERLQNPQRRAAAQVSLIHYGQVALKSHHTTSRTHILRSDTAQFLCEYLFQPLEGLGYHFKNFIHRFLYLFTPQIYIKKLTYPP